MATPKQNKFITDLLSQREVPDNVNAEGVLVRTAEARVENLRKYAAEDLLTVGEAKICIQFLLSLPKLPMSAPVSDSLRMLRDIPAGRYAIGDPTKFIHIQDGKEGTRWEGKKFVKQRAGDELYTIKNPNERAAAIREIAQDWQAAMIRYGLELGHCGHCGRTLTNEASRERGIGPVCAESMGF